MWFFSFQFGALFKVVRVDSTQPQALFFLADLLGNDLKDKSFYAQVR